VAKDPGNDGKRGGHDVQNVATHDPADLRFVSALRLP
jgi:hypothetical protein